MYNVRVTEVGGPVSFKVFDAFLVQEKEWKISVSFVALIRLFKMNLTVHFQNPVYVNQCIRLYFHCQF